MTADEIAGLVPAATAEEAEALAEWYATIARGVAAFPTQDLKTAEPPLRSTPGPTRP